MSSQKMGMGAGRGCSMAASRPAGQPAELWSPWAWSSLADPPPASLAGRASIKVSFPLVVALPGSTGPATEVTYRFLL